MAGLEGALLVARSYDDASRFQEAAARLLGGILGGAGRRGALAGPRSGEAAPGAPPESGSEGTGPAASRA